MIYCFTLAYNLPSEVEKVIKLLYEMNIGSIFKHLIVDLGFPLVFGEVIPNDLEIAKEINSQKLKIIAQVNGSDYVKMTNIGVSQNWTQVYKYCNITSEDCLIGCDPDEHPQNKNWVKAMGEVLSREDIGLCSLMMTAHVPLIKDIPHSQGTVKGNRIYWFPNGSLNWALIGLSGRFFNAIGAIPYPENAPRYGWIEGALMPEFEKHKMDWCVLPDYLVRHTDYELGDPGTSILLRLWKNDIIFKINEIGQPSFDEWLETKRKEFKNNL